MIDKEKNISVNSDEDHEERLSSTERKAPVKGDESKREDKSSVIPGTKADPNIETPFPFPEPEVTPET
jgi:hypothetical protein